MASPIDLAAMLRVELWALDDGPVDVDASLPADDPVFDQVDTHLVTPVRVEGRLSAAGPGRYYWRGRIEASVRLDCRRCLVEVTQAVDVPVDVLFMESEDVDDADVYSIPEDAPILDLREMVREEVLLALPDFVLCRDDCRGICPACGKELNLGPCQCAPAVDPRWAALNALKTDPAPEGS